MTGKPTHNMRNARADADVRLANEVELISSSAVRAPQRRAKMVALAVVCACLCGAVFPAATADTRKSKAAAVEPKYPIDTLTNEQLADEFVRSLGGAAGSPRVVTKWKVPVVLGLSIRDMGVATAAPYAENMPAELNALVHKKVDDIRNLLKIQMRWSTRKSAANMEFSLYGRRAAVDRWVVNLPRWFTAVYSAHAEKPPTSVFENIVYGGVAATRTAGDAIDLGGCAATYHLRKHYRFELVARQLLAAGLPKDEVARSMQDYQKPDEAVVKQRLSENDAKFPLDGACVQRDYMDRWGKIIDACFATMLGLHPAPVMDAPQDLIWNNQWSVVDLRYRSAGYSIYERYWPLFLQILYSDALPAGTSFPDARRIAFCEISARRAAFEAQRDENRENCTGVP